MICVTCKKATTVFFFLVENILCSGGSSLRGSKDAPDRTD